MVALFAANTDVLAYEGYFNRTNDPDERCRYRLDEGCNAGAAQAYLRLLGPRASVAGTGNATAAQPPGRTGELRGSG